MRSPLPPLVLLLAGAAAAQDPWAIVKPRLLTGRVVDELGRPIAGAAIARLGADDDTETVLASPHATSGEDGSYRLPFDSPAFLVVATATGRLTCRASLRPGAGDDMAAVDFRLLPGTTLTGRVCDADGAPVAGARVEASDALLTSESSLPRNHASGRTDASGTFQLRGVAVTGLAVNVSARGYYAQRRFAHAGEPLVLTLERSGVVRGRVVDPDGRPVAGVVVSGDAANSSTASAVDGSFALPVERRGRFRVGWRVPDDPAAYGTSDFLDGPADGVVLRCERAAAAPRRVSVRCVDAATRSPIAVFHASHQVSGAEPRERLAIVGHRHDRVRCEGVFSFPFHERSSGGPVHVVVLDAPGRACLVVPVPEQPPDPWVVELPAESALTGRVIDGRTGAPCSGAFVVALPSPPRGSGFALRSGAARTDADGRYRVGGLAAGEITVQAFANGRPASDERVVTVGARGAELELTVPEARWLALRWRDLPAGAPATLTWQVATCDRVGYIDWGQMLPGCATLGDEPQLRVGPLERVSYGLSLVRPSRVRADTVTRFALAPIAADQRRADVSLAATATGMLRGKVVLPAGVSPARVGVVAHADVGARRPAMHEGAQVAGLERDGSFVFDLPHGSWYLQLFDLETSIVFHTDDATLAVPVQAAAIEVRPEVHWLDVELFAEPGKPRSFDAIQVTLPSPPRGWTVFSPPPAESPPTPSTSLPASDVHCWRWLLPAGLVSIGVTRYRVDGPQSWHGDLVGYAYVDVRDAEHRVRIELR